MKPYVKPGVVSHSQVKFETVISNCIPPSQPGSWPGGNICVNPDGSWTPNP